MYSVVVSGATVFAARCFSGAYLVYRAATLRAHETGARVELRYEDELIAYISAFRDGRKVAA